MRRLNKNLHYLQPRNQRTRKYGEHQCFIWKKAEYVGTLMLDAPMRAEWRQKGYTVTIVDL